LLYRMSREWTCIHIAPQPMLSRARARRDVEVTFQPPVHLLKRCSAFARNLLVRQRCKGILNVPSQVDKARLKGSLLWSCHAFQVFCKGKNVVKSLLERYLSRQAILKTTINRQNMTSQQAIRCRGRRRTYLQEQKVPRQKFKTLRYAMQEC
jgi:hypothetical protein